jgi:hypothetical protein
MRILTGAAVLMMTVSAVQAAGSFDGEWSGGSPAGNSGSSHVCVPTNATVKVAAGKLSGDYSFGKYTYKISGTIAADGTVKGKWGGNQMTGKFEGDHFSGTYNSGQCGVDRKISLDKVK